MNKKQEISNNFDEAISWVKDHAKILILSFIGVGGGGTGIGFSDVIYQSFIDNIYDGLEMAKKDSILNNLTDKTTYQFGFNALTMDNYVDSICDGIPMKYNDKTKMFYVEWDGFVYHAVPEGPGVWVVYLFQWQLPPKADNRFVIDPLYFQLK